MVTIHEQRDRLVDDLLDRGYVHDPRVAEALRFVPREAFLEARDRSLAYEDRPVWIGWSQTMSAPHMVAIMCEYLDLQPGQRVLEIGTGSGYHAAVTARLVEPGGTVVTTEIIEPLASRAEACLRRAGINNVEVLHTDGSRGVEGGPFDRIYLTCSAPRIPPPLLEELKTDGILLAPIGEMPSRLVRARRDAEGTGWAEEDLGACAFVPLRGAFGVA